MLKCHLPCEVFAIPQLIVLSSALPWYVAYTFHNSFLSFLVQVFLMAVYTTRLKATQESSNYHINLRITHNPPIKDYFFLWWTCKILASLKKAPPICLLC